MTEGEISPVIDLDAILASKGVTAEAPVADVVSDEKVIEPVKAGDEPLKKIADFKTTDADADVDDVATEDVVKDEPLKKVGDIETKSDTEIAHPDDVMIDVNGTEMSATEVYTKYEEATTKLEAIEGDEWLKKFVDYKLKGGDPLAYFESQTRDWAKAGDFDLLREDFYSSDKVAGLDDEAKEELFAREISDKYSASIDGSYEDENSKLARVGKQLIKRDAEKLRASQIEKQKSFSLPKAEEKQQVVFDPAKERESVLKIEEVKKFMTDKLVRIADTGYAHEVENPEAVIGMMADQSEFWKLFLKKDGQTDWGKLTKVFAFANDQSKYENDLLSLGKSLGVEGYLKQGKNISRVRETNQDKQAADSAGTFNPMDFLKQMALQNKK